MTHHLAEHSIWHTRFRWVPLWLGILACVWPGDAGSPRNVRARALALAALVVGGSVARLARTHQGPALRLRQRRTTSCLLAAASFLVGGASTASGNAVILAVLVAGVGAVPWAVPDES